MLLLVGRLAAGLPPGPCGPTGEFTVIPKVHSWISGLLREGKKTRVEGQEKGIEIWKEDGMGKGQTKCDRLDAHRRGRPRSTENAGLGGRPGIGPALGNSQHFRIHSSWQRAPSQEPNPLPALRSSNFVELQCNMSEEDWRPAASTVLSLLWFLVSVVRLSVPAKAASQLFDRE